MRNSPAPNSGSIFATSTAGRDCCSASPRATGCCISAPADAPGIRRTARPPRRWRPTNILRAGSCAKPACRRLAANISSCTTAIARIARRDMSAATRSTVSGDWADAAFVKPLTGSRGDFAQAVHGEAALVRYLDDVMKYYDAVLIQPIVEGTSIAFSCSTTTCSIARENIRRPSRATACTAFRELLAAHNDALRARGLSPASLPDAIHRSMPYRRRANGGRFPGG